MQLGDLCNIYSGYTARGRLEPIPEGGVPAIQLRDVSPHGDVSDGSLLRYDLTDLSDRYLVCGDEVVFRSRGAPNTAAVVSAALSEPAAVILPLMILRPDKSRVLPAYLVWAINHPDAQRKLDSEAQGTNLRMIPKGVLERLEIPLPDLETQHHISTVDALVRREGGLLRELADRRAQFHSLILSERARFAAKQGYPQ